MNLLGNVIAKISINQSKVWLKLISIRYTLLATVNLMILFRLLWRGDLSLILKIFYASPNPQPSSLSDPHISFVTLCFMMSHVWDTHIQCSSQYCVMSAEPIIIIKLWVYSWYFYFQREKTAQKAFSIENQYSVGISNSQMKWKHFRIHVQNVCVNISLVSLHAHTHARTHTYLAVFLWYI